LRLDFEKGPIHPSPLGPSILTEDHSNLLELVFQLLHQEKCRVKRSKCSFAKREICYLRYVIRAAGVATSPAKVQAVAEWPTPKNVKELRSFLALLDITENLLNILV
jgi:hypothetical protein